jgi:hypothetical protein
MKNKITAVAMIVGVLIMIAAFIYFVMHVMVPGL